MDNTINKKYLSRFISNNFLCKLFVSFLSFDGVIMWYYHVYHNNKNITLEQILKKILFPALTLNPTKLQTMIYWISSFWALSAINPNLTYRQITMSLALKVCWWLSWKFLYPLRRSWWYPNLDFLWRSPATWRFILLCLFRWSHTCTWFSCTEFKNYEVY